MKKFIDFLVIFTCALVFYSPHVQATTFSPAEGFLQLNSSGHVMGFSSQRMYIVGLGYSLIESFVGTAGIVPVKGEGGQITYSELWPNITLQYEVRENGIAESMYSLKPGANVQDIRLRYNSPITINEQGSLCFSQANGQGRFTMTPPQAWQDSGGESIAVAVSYVQYGDQSIGFKVDGYDPDLPLLIDPVYQWHAFYGSPGSDNGTSIALDLDGNIYVTGTSDTGWNGPGQGLSPSPKHPYTGGSDIVVVKLNSIGEYQWHTFYGSSLYDEPSSISVDPTGHVYVTGVSKNSWNGPGNIFIPSLPKHGHSGSGSDDIFVLKLNSMGEYQWHTFYGSTANTSAWGIALDSSENLYISGISHASWQGPGGEDPINAYSGGRDIIVLSLNSDGEYQWHTFHGSLGEGESYSIAVDETGNIYVLGVSSSPWTGPQNQSPENDHSGGWDTFVMKLNHDGVYLWHTFYGSTMGNLSCRNMALDRKDDLYLVCDISNSWTGPQGEKPKHAYSGGADIVILKLTHSGAYQWHTLYGSSRFDLGRDIVIGKDGSIYAVGRSRASWNGPGGESPKNEHQGFIDVVVLKLNSSGDYSSHSFYGGSDSGDRGTRIAIDTSSTLYIAGNSSKVWSGPEGESAKNNHSGGTDILILKLGQSPFPWHMFRPAITGSQ